MGFFKMFIRFFCFLILILIISLISIQQLTKPKISGKINHNHAELGDISIYRDNFGIPHIKAKSYEASMYGLGYVHAQDRLWAMHFKRRISQGRISEFGGEETEKLDRLFRAMQIYNSAKK